MTNPSEHKLKLSVSTESLTFQYLVPEAGAYLGVVSGPNIYFKAPLRLTGISEDYCIPAPPEFFSGSKKPHAVVRFSVDGDYTIEAAPSLNVVFTCDAFGGSVLPGFYLGRATGSSVQFDTPAGRRDRLTKHTLLPDGVVGVGVDVPTLVQVC